MTVFQRPAPKIRKQGDIAKRRLAVSAPAIANAVRASKRAKVPRVEDHEPDLIIELDGEREVLADSLASDAPQVSEVFGTQLDNIEAEDSADPEDEEESVGLTAQHSTNGMLVRCDHGFIVSARACSECFPNLKTTTQEIIAAGFGKLVRKYVGKADRLRTEKGNWRKARAGAGRKDKRPSP